MFILETNYVQYIPFEILLDLDLQVFGGEDGAGQVFQDLWERLGE